MQSNVSLRVLVSTILLVALSSTSQAQVADLPAIPLGNDPALNNTKGIAYEKYVEIWADKNPDLAAQFGGATTRAQLGNLNARRNGIDVVVAVIDANGKPVRVLPFEVKGRAYSITQVPPKLGDMDRLVRQLRDSGPDGPWFADALEAANRNGTVTPVSASLSPGRNRVLVVDGDGRLLNTAHHLDDFVVDGMRRAGHDAAKIAEKRRELNALHQALVDALKAGKIPEGVDTPKALAAATKAVRPLDKVIKITGKVGGKVLIPIGLTIDGAFLWLELQSIETLRQEESIGQSEADLRRAKAVMDAILIGYLIDLGEAVDGWLFDGWIVDTAGPTVNYTIDGIFYGARQAGSTIEGVYEDVKAAVGF